MCTAPSDFIWGLIFDQTTPFYSLRLLRCPPQAAKGSVQPIPQIIARNVWWDGRFVSEVLRGYAPSTQRHVPHPFELYGPEQWVASSSFGGVGLTVK